MTTHSDGLEPGLLHEKLKDQVAVSIKDSLEKATTVLSSLHHLQSYLEVFKSMTPVRGITGGQHGSEGLRNALEQIRTVRNDTATLLQTVYLTEIGLQSLQETRGGSSGGNDLSSIMPILGHPIPGGSGLTGIGGGGGEGVDVMALRLEGSGEDIDFQSSGHASDGMPPAKKINLGVVISTCTSCSRKFATQRSNQGLPLLCKNCRQNPLPTPLAGMAGTLVAVATPVHSSTPTKLVKPVSSGKRSNLPPLLCKLCGICFHYRRCLLRHLRENHTGVDINNLPAYIEIGSVGTPEQEGKRKRKHEREKAGQEESLPVSQTSSLNVTVGTDIISGEEGDAALGSDEEDSDIAAGANSSLDAEGEEEGEGKAVGEVGILEGTGSSPTVETRKAIVTEGSLLKERFACLVCSKIFDRPYRLQRHMQIHDPNRPRVSCHICDRSFTRYDTLEGHIKSSHSEDRPFRCSHEGCTKSFPTQSALTHHLRAHLDGKPYRCTECDTAFALLGQYKQHMREGHPETYNLRCSECFRVFPDTQSLTQHKQLEHRVECEICGKLFARLGYLQFHAELHNGSSLFNCRYCKAGFDSEQAYKNHVKVHPEAHRPRKLYQCQLCEVSFHQASGLVAHYRTQEHRDKANALGVSGSLLNTIEADISDMSALVDEVTMAGEGNGDEEDDIIRSITNSEAFQSSTNSLVSNSSATFTSVSGEQDVAFTATKDSGTVHVLPS